MSVAESTTQLPTEGAPSGDAGAAGDGLLAISVVSPQAEIFSGRGRWIVAPGAQGSFGVWPRHAGLVATLSSGMLRIGLPGGDDLEYCVRGSFLSVSADVVTVLIDTVVSSPAEIEIEVVRAELVEVAEQLRGRLEDADHARLLDEREWLQAQIRFVERRPDWVPKHV